MPSPDQNQHLWQTDQTGPLDTAGYSLPTEDPSRPSLSGPYSGPGAGSSGSGLGGTTANPETPPAAVQPPPMTHGEAPRTLSHDQMMSEADRLIHQFHFVPGPSYVHPVIDRSNEYRDASMEPEWLAKYMKSIEKHDLETKRVRDLRAMR